MAYNISERFQPPSTKCYRLLDPTAYSRSKSPQILSSKHAFLSNTPRNTQAGNKLYTHAMYNPDNRPRIPNCTSLMAKRPRFPYEAFSKEDLEEILCRCGFKDPCDCPTEEKEQKEDIICQAKVRKRLFKGPPPHSSLGGGISAPSKRHRGFEILPDGSIRLIKEEVLDECPPFYDTRINEATAFYQGCKWSKWKSERALKSSEVRPGPSDYTLERDPTPNELCAEGVRAERRKTSKQLRYIELLQHKNISEASPGPATYSPQTPKGTDLQYIGPKTERFPTPNYDMRPDPTTYCIKREFSLPEIPEYPCHAKLPEPAFFGIKSLRFKPRREEGPGPASYDSHYKPCHVMHCSTAPFGCSAKRFKEIPEDHVGPIIDEDESEIKEENPCPDLTWQFKSSTLRMKPLEKKLDEPSPSDTPQVNVKVERSPWRQYIKPFSSSVGRFQSWNDWMNVYGKLNTPGPGYYSIEKPKCRPAVNRGPLFRATRFPENTYLNPAPNEYNVGGGIETVLATQNVKLKNNIQNQHKFHWEPLRDPPKLSFEQREMLLLDKAIALLDVENNEDNEIDQVEINKVEKTDVKKQKLLRCFLYKKPMPYC